MAQIKLLLNKINSNKLALIATFFLGWSTYSLKLVSIIKLLEELSLDYYPPLMLIQGILVFVFFRFVGKNIGKGILQFSIFSFSLALAVYLMANIINPMEIWGRSDYFSSIIFLLATISVLMIEVSIKSLQIRHISILKNPKSTKQLIFSLEIGVIFGATMTLVFPESSKENFTYLLGGVPLLLGGIFSVLLEKNEPIQEKKTKVSEKKNEINLFNFPFVLSLFILGGVILISKHIQGFAVINGLLELKETGGNSLRELFSYLNIGQTSLIIIFLVVGMALPSRQEHWAKGVKIFLWGQVVSMVVISFFSAPIFLLATGVIRKFNQHVLLNKSQPILESIIPLQVRFTIKSLQEKLIQTVGFILISIFSGLFIYTDYNLSYLWGIGGLFGLFGLYTRRRLAKTLNEYQVSNIVNVDVYSAVNSCYSLSNVESRLHWVALIKLLKRNPRPLLAKSIVYCLGEMKAEGAVPYLMHFYRKQDREDMQLICINSILKFKDYRIDLFLMKSLEALITQNTNLGELRISVFNAISRRLPILSIITLIKTVEEYKENEMVLANIVTMVGEIAQYRKDRYLFDYLVQFIDEKYTRRVRANAAQYLYHSKKYRYQAMQLVDSLLTSDDLYDRSAVAYLAGRLNLKGLLPFVLDLSYNQSHKNSTLLISLICMGHLKSCNRLGKLLLAQNESDSITTLNQLSRIDEVSYRLRVYESVLENSKENREISNFMEMLRKSKRDFDMDRKMIRMELSRRAINLDLNDQIFVTDEKKDGEKTESNAA